MNQSSWLNCNVNYSKAFVPMVLPQTLPGEFMTLPQTSSEAKLNVFTCLHGVPIL